MKDYVCQQIDNKLAAVSFTFVDIFAMNMYLSVRYN